jgi:hypothetical protein
MGKRGAPLKYSDQAIQTLSKKGTPPFFYRSKYAADEIF